MSGSVKTAAVAACSVAVVFLAVEAFGHGSSDSSSTSTTGASSATGTEQWVHDVCFSVSAWRSNMSKAAASIPESPSKQDVQRAAQHAHDWTTAFVSKLRSLGSPGTTAGAQAKAELSTLESQLSTGAKQLKTTADSISGPRGSVEAVATLSSTLVTMRDQVKATGSKLRSLPTGELRQAVAASPACQDLAAKAKA